MSLCFTVSETQRIIWMGLSTRHSDITIFNMAAVRYFECSKFAVLPFHRDDDFFRTDFTVLNL